MSRDKFELHLFLPYLLNQAAEASSLQFEQIYRSRYGLVRAEWRVLFHLGLYGRMTATEICQSANMHKTKISRAVQRLVERRFVARSPHEVDRRVEHLCLSAQGAAAYADLYDAAMQYDAKLTAGLTAQERDMLQHMLVKLAGRRPAGFT